MNHVIFFHTTLKHFKRLYHLSSKGLHYFHKKDRLTLCGVEIEGHAADHHFGAEIPSHDERSSCFVPVQTKIWLATRWQTNRFWSILPPHHFDLDSWGQTMRPQYESLVSGRPIGVSNMKPVTTQLNCCVGLPAIWRAHHQWTNRDMQPECVQPYHQRLSQHPWTTARLTFWICKSSNFTNPNHFWDGTPRLRKYKLYVEDDAPCL